MNFLIILTLIVGLLVIVEISLRVLFGFGNPLVYIPDSDCGYLLAPNQTVRRFGNRIEINQYSMRSPAIAPIPPTSTLRILLLGDSIANGGWWTNQPDTISEIIARLLRQKNHSNVEVLNASANSWGPQNELAYLQKFGHFGAQILVLLINTDDLFAKIPSSLVVGRDRNYPDRKPPSAIIELCSRHLFPVAKFPEIETQTSKRGDIVGDNLEAIGKIQTIATSANAQFVLAMTPLLREISDRSPRDYEIQARNRLTEFTQTEQIIYLDFLPIFNSIQQPTNLYRDNIHLSPQGNQLVSETISLLTVNS
ncbi:lipolytic protein G-D-S-L family [Oscillatoriales cyanobacterium USR001]|nr:lipolytic protein G-D-S-L family [Oscillatoriales cyanobacterium USR001]